MIARKTRATGKKPAKKTTKGETRDARGQRQSKAVEHGGKANRKTAKKKASGRRAASASQSTSATGAGARASAPSTSARKKATKKAARTKSAAAVKAVKRVTRKRTAADDAVESGRPRDARAIIARLHALGHLDDEAGLDRTEVDQLLDRLQDVIEPSLLPSLFALLEENDPHGVKWSIFYMMEGLDEAYLDGLLMALPALYERSPRWAQTAVIRVLNTRGDDDDCVAEFEELARQSTPAIRGALGRLLRELVDDGDLTPDQIENIAMTLAAIGEDGSSRTGAQRG